MFQVRTCIDVLYAQLTVFQLEANVKEQQEAEKRSKAFEKTQISLVKTQAPTGPTIDLNRRTASYWMVCR